jgi:hypothetical protein
MRLKNPLGAFYHLRQNPYSFRVDPFDARLQLTHRVPDVLPDPGSPAVMVTLLDLIGKQSLASPLFSRRQSLFNQVFPENNRFYLFFQSATSSFTLL